MRVAIVVLDLTTNHFARSQAGHAVDLSVEFASDFDVLERYAGTSTVIGGAIDFAQQHGFELVPTFFLEPGSAPTLADADLHALCRRVGETIAKLTPAPDAILLRMSGAMRSATIHAADELILQHIRAGQPGTPIAAVLSPHANVTSDLVRQCDVVLDAGFGDPSLEHQRGAHALELVAECARGRSFSQGWQSRPMVASLGATYHWPDAARTLRDHVRVVVEYPDVRAVSLFGGYPYTDAPQPHFSVVSQTTGNDAQAARIAAQIADIAWSLRHELNPPTLNVEAAVHSAMDSASGPVALADLGDDPMFGAPGDGTTILWALLDLGARNAVLGPICDPETVARCAASGLGSFTTVSVGGKRDNRNGYPIDVNGVVTHISEHRLHVSETQGTSVLVNPGQVVVLRARARHHGSVEIVLTERQVMAQDPSIFSVAGIDLHARQIIAIKSNGRYRHTFGEVATAYFDVATPGITTPDLNFFDFDSLRRPLYPLDDM
jgi:microcystin degradation protein MlrC